MPEDPKPVTPPVPDPEPDPKPDPRDTHIARLNKENADRRIEAKKANDERATLEKKLTSILTALEIDNEEELDTKLGEYRATKLEKGNPDLDPKVLLRAKTKLEDELKKTRDERDKLSGEFSTLTKTVQDKTIGGALRDEITKRGVRPAYHRALELDLRENVRLDEGGGVVWISKGKDGTEQFPLPLNEGVDEFFKKNPDWLPAATPEGSGSGAGKTPQFTSGKPLKDMTLSEYNKVRDKVMQ